MCDTFPRLLLGVNLIAAAGLTAVGAEPTDQPSGGRRLRVITYNVQFLPGIAEVANLRRHADYRARTIGDRLAAYDIIGLNETFEPAHREILLRELRRKLGKDFNCVTPPARERSAFGVGSGLALVSRLPILASHTMPYGNDSSVWKYGLLADGFAAKGAMHARLGLTPNAKAPAECLDVFITHLESQESAAREAQYGKFADFIRTHGDVRTPALIMGDFNTVGNRGEETAAMSQYRRMLTRLRSGRRNLPLLDLGLELLPKNPGTSDPDAADGGERIDYIFLSSPANAVRGLNPLSLRLNRMADPEVKTLSDHAAVEAELQWGPNPP